MSLKAFHIFFITASTLLSAGLAFWGITNYRSSNDRTDLMLAIVGIVALLLLIPYFRWFRRKMKSLSIILTAAIPLLPLQEAWACPVCFGDPNSLMTQGLKKGIVFLIVVVGGVLAAILGIALTWAKRAKALPRT